MTEIKKNFFYSAFLTSANYIFPLLIFPYVTRVLGVAKYGLCGFIDGIINYFILFSTMGIAVVGIREIASVKTDQHRLTTTFMNLFTSVGLFTLWSIIALILATFLVPKLYEQKELMFLGAFKVGFNFLLIEWFYKGIEDFRFITLRTLIVKCIYVAGVFCFVKDSDDYVIFYLLSVLMVGGNSVINMLYSRKWIFYSFRSLNIKQFLKPLLTYGVYFLLTSFYTTFNVAYLGFVSTDTEVGYYSVATKLYSIFISLISSFTAVMMPRMASLLADKKVDEFRWMYIKSVDILTSVSLPFVFYTIVMAPQIVTFIAGNDYEGAVLPLRIVMPLMFIIGYEQIMIIQGLMPMRQDKIVLRNSAIGAVIGLIANVLIVGHLRAVGSAIVWLLCEILILILSQSVVSKSINVSFPIRFFGKNLLVCAPILLLYLMKPGLVENTLIELIITCLITGMYFVITQIYFFPESISGRIIKKLFFIKFRITK